MCIVDSDVSAVLFELYTPNEDSSFCNSLNLFTRIYTLLVCTHVCIILHRCSHFVFMTYDSRHISNFYKILARLRRYTTFHYEYVSNL